MNRYPIGSSWVLLLVFLLSTSVFAQSELIPEVLSASSGECIMGTPADEVLGVTIICGQIEVPQNWLEPDGIALTISYAILRNKSFAPALDAVIYFEGGPGGSALASLNGLKGSLEKIREHRDVIIWDQRGTTFSTELFCPEAVQITNPETYDQQESEGQTRLESMSVNAYSDPDEVWQIVVEFSQLADRSRCVPYLEAKGLDLTQFSTENTVLDAIALMKHLGYPAYNLFGVSYGSTVALAIMDYIKNHDKATLPVIRSSVIEGIAPRNRSWVEVGYEQVWPMLQVFSQCENDANCEAAYPNIRQRAIDLTASLQNLPLISPDDREITLEDVLAILRAATSTSSLARPYLPRMIAELEQGETATFEVLQAALAYTISLPEQLSKTETPAAGNLSTQLDQLDAQFEAIKDQVGLLLLTEKILTEATTKARSRPELFVALINGYLETLSTARPLFLGALHAPSIHPNQRTRQNLLSLVTTTVFFPTLSEQFSTLINLMTEDEIAEVYTKLTSAVFQGELVNIVSLTNRVVNCNYFSNTMFNKVAFETYPTFEAPHLIGPEALQPANYQYSCEQLGLAAETFSPPPPGVSSSIRTLVLNGALDANTPVVYAERAMEGLSNAKLIVVPEESHGFTVLGDECGQALVNAFVLSPNENFNQSCVDAKRIVFVLPDAELPALP